MIKQSAALIVLMMSSAWASKQYPQKNTNKYPRAQQIYQEKKLYNPKNVIIKFELKIKPDPIPEITMHTKNPEDNIFCKKYDNTHKLMQAFLSKQDERLRMELKQQETVHQRDLNEKDLIIQDLTEKNSYLNGQFFEKDQMISDLQTQLQQLQNQLNQVSASTFTVQEDNEFTIISKQDQ